MSVEKEPLNGQELARLVGTSKKFVDGGIIRVLRYTGMHVSVLCDPKYRLRQEKDDKGRDVIVWERPKKKGKDAITMILRSKDLDVEINTFVPKFQARKRRKSRQYVCNLVKFIGEKASLVNISPMTLRHSVCVEMLEKGVPEAHVRQLLNVGPESMRHYSRIAARGHGDVLERVGW